MLTSYLFRFHFLRVTECMKVFVTRFMFALYVYTIKLCFSSGISVAGC